MASALSFDPANAADTRRILGLLADELIAARDQLESLADSLCCDEQVVTRFMSALQTLDSVGQRQAAIAEIIRAENIPDTARGVSLEAIVRRLDADR